MIYIASEANLIQIVWGSQSSDEMLNDHGWQWEDAPAGAIADELAEAPPSFLSRCGFAAYRIKTHSPYTASNLYMVIAPWWFLSAFTAAMPLYVLLALLRRRYMRGTSNARLCAICGYDLRATPNRCPECGAVAGPLDTARERAG